MLYRLLLYLLVHVNKSKIILEDLQDGFIGDSKLDRLLRNYLANKIVFL